MPADLLLRLALAATLIAAGVAVYWGWNRWQLRRLRRAATASLLGLETRPRGVPAVLYFRTPDCVVCAAAQRPALDRLAKELGPAVHIIEIDAAAQPAIADYWGVLSAPTTFIIDAQGQPRAVNHGLASQDKLRRQLQALASGETPRPAPRTAAANDLDAAPVRDTMEAA